ncbi:MAG: zinc ABC transporter solute-binding protein [Deltaproteobacteria bacterium]|nr:zinc ABC transporter solute-binding protein [Deltaproteobacteria bacterium]
MRFRSKLRDNVKRICVGIVIVVLAGCAPVCAAALQRTLWVSIAPLAFVAEQIGGGHIDVKTLLPDGQDPHIYAPTPRKMRALLQAGRLLILGMPFERRLREKLEAMHNSLEVVDCSRGVPRRRLRIVDTHLHGSHVDEPVDGDQHIWLGMEQLKGIAGNVKQALIRIDAGRAADYEAGYTALLAQCAVVQAQNSRRLAPHRGKKIFVYHPAFGYFLETYGLRQKPVEIAGKSPSPKQMAGLMKEAARDHVTCIFVQPQFDSKSARAIAAAIGGTVVPLDPLAKDVLKNMVHMANEIADALQK